MATLKTKKGTAATAPAASIADNQFAFGEKKYRLTMQKVKLPVQGTMMEMTAADICISEDAQKYLVENKCGCIEEVIE